MPAAVRGMTETMMPKMEEDTLPNEWKNGKIICAGLQGLSRGNDMRKELSCGLTNCVY